MAPSNDERPRTATAGSLLANVPDRLDAERFDPLLNVANVRSEWIVSTGQTTPPGEWFDQGWDEWVLVVTGAAEILWRMKTRRDRSGQATTSSFRPHVRRRVTWTTPERPTVWLAIHIDSPVPESG